MPHIEITSTEIDEFSGTARKTGNPFTIRNQGAFYFKGGEKYPTPIQITMKDGQTPYAPGYYDIHPNSIKPDRNGRLTVDLQLVPKVAQAQDKKAG